MNEEIKYMVDTLKGLAEELSSKPKGKIVALIKQINKLQNEIDSTDLMKIQDEIEFISNMPNVDSLTRIELSNILSDIENLL